MTHEHVPDVTQEDARLCVLGSFAPDALEDDPELAAIAGFAAKLCEAPRAHVTLVEETRQRFLASAGSDERETPRSVSFCAHAMLGDALLEVPDATKDPRFADNPLLQDPVNLRFYAGQPLISEEGAPLGALCVIDTVARPEGLTDLQREGLAVLGNAVMRRLNARRKGLAANRAIAEREQRLLRVIDGVPTIAWSADAEGNFDYFNSRWREWIGDDPPEVADDWRPFVHPDDADAAFAAWSKSFSEGEEFETEYRMKHADGSWRWVLSLAVPVAKADGEPVRWFGTITDIDETRQALEQRDTIAHELSHRIKNIFAVVIGLATLKARRRPEHQPFAEDLVAALRALGRAHEFVNPGRGAAQESLQGVLQALFAPYTGEQGKPLVKVRGTDADVSGHAILPLSLVFHELATNSAKYGALSADEGYVTLDITDAGEHLALTWTEIGGPPVNGEGEPGFGSRLVEMSVKGQLQGAWERNFAPDGLVVSLLISKAAIGP